MLDKVKLYAPIEKTDEELRMVYGYASTEAMDSQGEIVKKDALANAMKDYMRFANIREMHQPSAVGKAKQAQIDKKGMYISAKIVDDNAWMKVKEGVYSGFSIGGRVEQMIDNEITELKLSEISLVDRPANPEAVFDVFKADNIETTEEEVEVKEEIQKDMYGADYLVDLACGLASFIYSEKAQGEDSAKLEGALKSIKSAIVMELKEGEAYDKDIQDAFAYAEEVLDLKKDAVTNNTYVMNEEKPVEVKEEVVEAPVEEVAQKETVEAKEDTQEAVTEEAKVEPVAEEVKTEEEVVEEKPVEEVVEPVVEEKAEKTSMEKVAELIMQAKMPDDTLIAEMLKSQEVEVTDKAIDAARWELAGKVLKIVSKSVYDVDQADAIKQAAEKAVEKQDKPVEEVRHQWDEVKVVINKFAESLKVEMEKSTSAEVPVVPQAPVSPIAPNEQTSEALRLLQEAVKLLTSTGQGNQLTSSEEEKLRNGVEAGSTQAGGGHVKAEETKDLSKLEIEVKELKDQLEKLANEPEPVKIKTSYTVVEKFTNDKSGELEKALEKADELHIAMKENPSDEALVKEAQKLSAKIQKLQRETK